jgi:hypothetical protein
MPAARRAGPDLHEVEIILSSMIATENELRAAMRAIYGETLTWRA